MRRYAFTLIELLVVISIIAILSTILIPVIGMVRTQANNTVCMNHARQLTVCALTYANDQDGHIDFRYSGQADSAGDWTVLVQAAGFIEDRRIYSCPTSRHVSGISYGNFLKKLPNFENVAQPSFADWNCNYGAHVQTMDKMWGGWSDPIGPIGSTGQAQGTLTHLAQATANDCLLTEFSMGGASGSGWLGLGRTHWGKDPRPVGLTTSWFDGGVSRCPESMVVEYYGTSTVSGSFAR